LQKVPDSLGYIADEEARVSYPRDILERDERISQLRQQIQTEQAYKTRLENELACGIKP